MNEENESVKISMPLIDNIELQKIDTFYNDIVSEYTKAFVKEKEQVIVQRLMMNLQQENQKLKEELKIKQDDFNCANDEIRKLKQQVKALNNRVKKLNLEAQRYFDLLMEKELKDSDN